MQLIGRCCGHARVRKDRNVRKKKERRRHWVSADTEAPQHPFVKETTVWLY